MKEKDTLFTELTPEEVANVTGGATQIGFNLETYTFILGAGVLFGNPGLTPEEIQFAWEKSFIFEEPQPTRYRRKGRRK